MPAAAVDGAGDEIDGLDLPGDSQSYFDDVEEGPEARWRRKIVPPAIIVFSLLWAAWAGRRVVPAIWSFPKKSTQGMGADLSEGGVCWNSTTSVASSLSPEELRAHSDAAFKRWEETRLSKQLEAQEKKWKGSLAPQLKELEARLQKDVATQAKELETRVAAVQKGLKDLESKLVSSEKGMATRLTQEEQARLALQKELREASDRLTTLTSEAKALTKVVEQGAYERAASAQQPQKGGEAVVSPAVLGQLKSLQTQFEGINAKFEGVSKEAKSVESALTQLRQDTDKKVQQALAAIHKPDASPKAAVGLSSSDEEALRQKVVLPEIQRLLQAEREANEEALRHLEETVQLTKEDFEKKKEELDQQREKFEAEAHKLLLAHSEAASQLADEGPLVCPEPVPASASGPAASCPDLKDFDKLVHSAVEKRLQQLQGDEVRSVDHASFRMQSYVVPDMTSSTYTPTSHYIPTDWVHFLGYSSGVGSRDEIINPRPKGPGDCWPMKGQSGNVTIALYAPLHISNVTVEHIDPAINPTSDSAPRDFRVWGRRTREQEPFDLGTYRFDAQSKVVQTYVVRRAPSPVQFVTFEILSNHGRPDFTCIYRLRVHGSVANP